MSSRKSGPATKPLDVMKFKMAQPSLIEASAGTGKTYTITNLVLRALLGVGKKENNLDRPLQIDELLIVTFTNAATSDLRQRIYERIRFARTCIEEFISFAMSHVNDALALRSDNIVMDSENVARKIKKKASSLKKTGKGTGKSSGSSKESGKGSGKGGSSAKNAASVRVKSRNGVGLDGDSYEYLDGAGAAYESNVIDEERHALSQARNYSDEELQDILIEIRVADALAKIDIHDDVITSIIEDLLDRNDTPLRQAALILVRAERRINQAAICTIHSFCNSTLTQIYALESGEAFNTELRTDLADLEHEAWYNVWRRLFYRNDSSAVLLNMMGTAEPEGLQSVIHQLNSVRLSSPHEGFYGFELSGFDRIIKGCGLSFDPASDLEEQFTAFIPVLENMYHQLSDVVTSRARDFVKNFSFAKLCTYFDPQTCDFGPAFNITSKFALRGPAKPMITVLGEVLSLTEQLIEFENGREIEELREDADWRLMTSEINSKVEFLLKGKIKSDTYVYTVESLTKNKAQPEERAVFEEFTAPVSLFLDEVRAAVAPFDVMRKSGDIMVRTLTAICMIRETDRLCKEQHVMSNDDVLRRLDHALNGRGAMGDRLAWAIRSRYPLAMIDEFQDTDPVQFNIFTRIYLNEKALEEGAYCYLIGDPKQSIYAFRGSDINSYLKARSKIDELTSGKGIYTLDTNYRSSPDVVESSNAVFDTVLNHANINPFDDSNIRFTPVNSGLANRLHARIKSTGKGKGDAQLLDRDFSIDNMQRYLVSAAAADTSSDAAAAADAGADAAGAAAADAASEGGSSSFHSVLSGLKFSQPANTYIVDSGSDFSSAAALRGNYARCAAMLVKKILNDGKIVKDGVSRPVRSGDIAVLVRSVSENDMIQQAFKKLNIQSVYFSDRSSVLKNEGEPTTEAIDLMYLMEAMCDCTSREKVSRVLGSQLLSLTTEQFKARVSGDSFEKEVAILQSCAHTWAVYGFMPAFLQWADHSDHQVSTRLLRQTGGERLYTNYTHVAEIIQSAHNHKVGIQSQLHWFITTLERPVSEFDSDDIRKRLESEQDQVKVMTIHKSKGLEFPVVIMPNLWIWQRESSRDSSTVKFYDAEEAQHMVLDFEPQRTVNITRTLPVVDSTPADTGKVMSVQSRSTPKDLSEDEERRENTRLLYVAITRARYANFIFTGGVSRLSSNMVPSSLAAMHGRTDLANVIDESRDNMVCPAPHGNSADHQLLLNAAAAMPEAFTILDGKTLDDDYQILADRLNPLSSATTDPAAADAADSVASADSVAVAAPAADAAAGSASSREFTDEQELLDAEQFEVLISNKQSIAQSFLMRNAIDSSFNIASFSSIVKGVKSPANPGGADGSDEDRSDRGSSDDTDSSSQARIAQQNGGYDFDDPQSILSEQYCDDSPAITGPCVSVNKKCSRELQSKPELSWSALMNSNWHSGIYHNYTGFREEIALDKPLYATFPRGNNAGSFMHDVLEHIEFEKIRQEGFQTHLNLNVVPEVVNSSRYSSVLRLVSQDSNLTHKPLSEWFNDVVEAPIVQGKYHTLALADLEPVSYEREMRFLMSNRFLQSSKLDVLCRRVAADLLPHDLQYLKNGLRLSPSEIRGFITGSIDLACRFDLNARMQLRERPDLYASLDSESADSISRQLKAARTARLNGVTNLSECDPEMFADASFEQVRRQCVSDEGRCWRYYVIDYKSNYLGDSYEDYSRHNMISAVYKHRYDLQFMIYTLALYRHLKRRMAIPFDAGYEQLREFYDSNVGGVLYLFLRGMKANYMRDALSSGVFSTRLDFSVVYELDQILSGAEH